MEKQAIQYRSQVKLTKEYLKNVPIEHDKEFIISFLRQLPFDKLKELVSFQELDFENEQLWEDAKKDKYLYEKLVDLRNKKIIEFNVLLNI